MSSAVKADNLEAALEAAIRRFDGTSPVTPQVHAYFGYAGDAAASDPRSRMRLVLEVVAEEGGSLDAGVDVACAVEILHCSTLVHDTVEDADAFALRSRARHQRRRRVVCDGVSAIARKPVGPSARAYRDDDARLTSRRIFRCARARRKKSRSRAATPPATRRIAR